MLVHHSIIYQCEFAHCVPLDLLFGGSETASSIPSWQSTFCYSVLAGQLVGTEVSLQIHPQFMSYVQIFVLISRNELDMPAFQKRVIYRLPPSYFQSSHLPKKIGIPLKGDVAGSTYFAVQI